MHRFDCNTSVNIPRGVGTPITRYFHLEHVMTEPQPNPETKLNKGPIKAGITTSVEVAADHPAELGGRVYRIKAAVIFHFDSDSAAISQSLDDIYISHIGLQALVNGQYSPPMAQGILKSLIQTKIVRADEDGALGFPNSASMHARALRLVALLDLDSCAWMTMEAAKPMVCQQPMYGYGHHGPFWGPYPSGWPYRPHGWQPHRPYPGTPASTPPGDE
jgi:hypothetical protein